MLFLNEVIIVACSRLTTFKSCFISTSNEVLIRTSNLLTDDYFIYYSTICNVVLDKLQGVIESPNFPDNYPPYLICAWDIKGGKHDKINLAISYLKVASNVENEIKYYGLEVVDMLNDKVVSVQSLENPTAEVIKSTGNRLLIKFNSDDEGTGIGFRAEYKRVGCGEHMSDFIKKFATPNIPFSLDMDCEWYIEVDAGYRIELTFTDLKIDTDMPNCTNDGIVVAEYKNSPIKLLAECLINEEPVTVTSPANRLHIRFYSSDKRSKKYFSASYRARKVLFSSFIYLFIFFFFNFVVCH